MPSHSQTEYFQREVIEAAKKDGTLGNLFWYIEVLFPKQELPPGIKAQQPAQYPAGCIPVLPAGPDAEMQQEWIKFLADMFTAYNEIEAKTPAALKRTFKPTLSL